MEFRLELFKYAPLVGAYRPNSTTPLRFTTNVNTLKSNLRMKPKTRKLILRTHVNYSKSRVVYS